jgi:hypothetical protein
VKTAIDCAIVVVTLLLLLQCEALMFNCNYLLLLSCCCCCFTIVLSVVCIVDVLLQNSLILVLMLLYDCSSPSESINVACRCQQAGSCREHYAYSIKSASVQQQRKALCCYNIEL